MTDPVGGLDQAGGGLPSQLLGLGVAQPEFDPVPVGLLQVVADELVVLTGPPGHPGLQPARVSLVQVGPLPLRRRLVGAVAQQDVQEPERLHPGQVRPVGMDQLLADQ